MGNKSKGFGDTVDKFTSATGIKTVTKAVFGDSCGCDARKKWLNKKLPYKKIKKANKWLG